MARIAQLRADGTSFLFASHNLDQVAEQCDRVLWLEAGSVRGAGPAADVVEAYREAMHTETDDRTPAPDGRDGPLVLRENRFGSQEVTIEQVRVAGSASRGSVEAGGSLAIELTLRRAGTAIDDPVVGVSIHRASDDVTCCEVSTDADEVGRASCRERV